jgi:WD40 repeat protein
MPSHESGPVLRPTYILQGHGGSAVHSVRFWRQNSRILTGDSEGYIILWKSYSRRPVSVWRAHKGCILNIDTWNDDKILSFVRHSNLLKDGLKADLCIGMGETALSEFGSCHSPKNLISQRSCQPKPVKNRKGWIRGCVIHWP